MRLPLGLILLLLPACAPTDYSPNMSEEQSDSLSDYYTVKVRTTGIRNVCHASEVSDACDEISDGSVNVSAYAQIDGGFDRRHLLIKTERIVLHRPEGGAIRISAGSSNLLGTFDFSSAAIDVDLVNAGSKLELRENFPRDAYLEEASLHSIKGLIERTANGPAACDSRYADGICDSNGDLLDLSIEPFGEGGYSVEIHPIIDYDFLYIAEGNYEISVDIEPLAEE